jgi:hypothetical protein
MRLYCYPFDDAGHEILTFPEALAATQELTLQISKLIGDPWRWCDVRLVVVLRHPTYRIYEVEHHGLPAGRVTVLPCRTEASGLESPIRDWRADLPRSA